MVECLICLETFKYDGSLLNDFTEGKMEVKFSSLKRNLKEHFNTLKHRRLHNNKRRQTNSVSGKTEGAWRSG